MNDTLRQKLAKLPANSGVYRFYDENEVLLYVGKAKVLKNRVKSYFRSDLPSARIAKMVSQIADLQITITPSEADALILENSLIKQLKPRYNILLRDDKTYPYIAVDFAREFPRLELTRKVQKGKKVVYFGPYYRGASEILEAVYSQFALVQKSSCLREKKACLFAQISRCHAPCEGRISKEDYARILQEAIKAVKNPALLLKKMQEEMAQAAACENFEQAAALRDKIQAVQAVSRCEASVDLAKAEDFDAFSVAKLGEFACVVRFSVREGKVAGVKSDICEGEELSGLYKQALLAAYKSEIPLAVSRVYVADEFEDFGVVSEILKQRFGKFELKVAKIGDKKRLCEVARQNALLTLKDAVKDKNGVFLREFSDFFGLDKSVRRIEVFDNSQLFGEAIVGGMVVWEFGGVGETGEDGAQASEAELLKSNLVLTKRQKAVFGGRWDKQSYRYFHLSGASDFEQMKEILTKRAMKFGEVSPPDLWVIDGGEALVRLARQVVASVGASVEVIGVAKEKIDAKAHRAKGRAQDKIWTKFGEVKLTTSDEKLLFLQALRDEAHRFAISFHRQTRSRNTLNASRFAQLKIPAGESKKLLDYFGSFEAVFNADFEELRAVCGGKIARKIAEFNASE